MLNVNVCTDELVQERRNSIANALELHLSCTNPSEWSRITSSMVLPPVQVLYDKGTCWDENCRYLMLQAGGNLIYCIQLQQA